MLHFFNPVFTVLATLAMVFGSGVALSSFDANLKSLLLSFDRDGFKILGVGVLGLVVGLIVPDYTAAYVLSASGLFAALLGFWIALPDPVTNVALHRIAGAVYWTIFVTVLYVSRMVYGTANPALVVHYLVRLTVPVTGVALLLSLIYLSVVSKKFKTNVLPLDYSGKPVMVSGVVPLVATLFVGTNPAMVIALGALGSGLLALGFLISLWDEITTPMLKWYMVLPYAAAIIYLLSYSRSVF